MDIVRLTYGDEIWEKTESFAESCPWLAGKHLSSMMKSNSFKSWECVIAAVRDGEVIGFCALLEEDYYPDNKYSPWISSVFVDESARGERVSHSLVEEAARCASEQGFKKVYIPSEVSGLYEKCGFKPIDKLVNYGGKTDIIYERETTDIWRILLEEAEKVRAPRTISPFVDAGSVSAAIMTKAGNIYTGVCIDTASSLGICAERNAIACMITHGESKISKVVAITPDGSVGAPCGACRELMMQLNKDSGDIEILLDAEKRRTITLNELSPEWWGKRRFEEQTD